MNIFVLLSLRSSGLYGRSIKENRRTPHLYLRGGRRGIFNRKASKVYDEIILTESIIDAMSLVAMGLENVQALYGVNGFTEEHLKVLKQDRVKRVVLGFDNDEAGKKGAEEQTEKFLAEGFEVKQVFPTLKDWNEELCSKAETHENGSIKEQIERAKTLRPETLGAKTPGPEGFRPESPRTQFSVTKDGPRHLFRINGISYRVLGVKKLFVSSLRVNIRVKYAGVRFLDNVDLYSAHSRTGFSQNLSRLFNVELQRIEYDLLGIVEYLEEERDRRLSEGGAEEVELTEEERNHGMELLLSADLFERIVSDLEVLGYVGEEINKQLVYIAASSRKLDDPLSVLILSQSAAGKSLLVDTLRRLIPRRMWFQSPLCQTRP